MRGFGVRRVRVLCASPSRGSRRRQPSAASGRPTPRTRGFPVERADGRYAFAENGEVGSGPLAQYHPLDGASAPLLITAPAVGQRLRSSPDGAGSATGSGRGDEDPAAMAQVGARADLRSDMASAATEPRTVEPGAGVDPGPACVMRAHRDAIHPASHNASPTRQNPPERDPCDPTSHNASPDDITRTTPSGAEAGVAASFRGCGPESTSSGGGARRRTARRIPCRVLRVVDPLTGIAGV